MKLWRWACEAPLRARHAGIILQLALELATLITFYALGEPKVVVLLACSFAVLATAGSLCAVDVHDTNALLHRHCEEWARRYAGLVSEKLVIAVAPVPFRDGRPAEESRN